MKLARNVFTISAIAAAFAACDGGTTNNPATADRADLNPPTGLISLTGDGEVTLRWLGNNTEKDFKGYNVFMGEGDFSSWTAGYPSNANLASGSIPRCKDNSAVFEKLGFAASTKDCEGDTATDTNKSAALQDDTPVEETIKFVKCEGANDNLSVPAASETVLGMQSCKITGLTNGTTYSFVVMSVMGAEFEKLSWSSNFISDTPAVAAFSGDLTIEQGKHLFLSHADLVAAIGGTKLTADKFVVNATCPDEICRINRKNSVANAAGIYFGRRGTADTYPARVFFSAPEGKTTDSVMYLYRGGQTHDPENNGVVSTTIPGDQAKDAIDQTGIYAAGTQIEVLGNEVIDIAIKKDSGWHYGKIVLDVPTLEAPVTATSKMTIKVTLIIQPAAGNPHYLQ